MASVGPQRSTGPLHGGGIMVGVDGGQCWFFLTWRFCFGRICVMRVGSFGGIKCRDHTNVFGKCHGV